MLETSLDPAFEQQLPFSRSVDASLQEIRNLTFSISPMPWFEDGLEDHSEKPCIDGSRVVEPFLEFMNMVEGQEHPLADDLEEAREYLERVQRLDQLHDFLSTDESLAMIGIEMKIETLQRKERIAALMNN